MAVAVKYATDEGPHACVRLTKGWVHTWDGIQGVSIPCEAVDVEAVVSAAALHRISKVVDAPEFRTTKTRLEIKGARGAKYRLPIPTKKPSVPPRVPATGWKQLTTTELSALVGLAATVDVNVLGAPGMAGIGVTPTWAVSASNTSAAAVWVAGLTSVAEGVTVSPGPFKGLTGEGEMLITKRDLWVRETATGQVRWCRVLAADFPLKAIGDVVTQTRAQVGAGTTVSLDPGTVSHLLKQADATASSPAHVGKLTVDTTISMTIEGLTGDFSGEVACDSATGGPRTVGVVPSKLLAALKMVETTDGTPRSMVVGSVSMPIYLTGGETVAVEVLVMPQRIPA
jgi:hypothetical protein